MVVFVLLSINAFMLFEWKWKWGDCVRQSIRSEFELHVYDERKPLRSKERQGQGQGKDRSKEGSQGIDLE